MQNLQNLSQREKLLLGVVAVVIVILGSVLLGTGEAPKQAAAVSACSAIMSEWVAAHPTDAAPKQTYSGDIPNISFDGAQHPQLDRLKNGIASAAKKGANFAGHYAVVEWGCGSNCQEHAVVDVATGKTIAFGIASEAGLKFTADSNVIVSNPAGNFPTRENLASMSLDDKIYWYNLPREYYVLEEAGGTASVRRICIENAFEN